MIRQLASPRTTDTRESLTLHFNENDSCGCVGIRQQDAKGRNGELIKNLIKLCKMMIAWTRKEPVKMVRNAQILDIFWYFAGKADKIY